MSDPTHDFDRFSNNEENMELETAKRKCKPKNGLFSKFWVFRTKYTEIEVEGGTDCEVDMVPLTLGSVVLVPFNEDGSVRDEAAIVALKAYIEHNKDINSELYKDVKCWLDNPWGEFTQWLNVPIE